MLREGEIYKYNIILTDESGEHKVPCTIESAEFITQIEAAKIAAEMFESSYYTVAYQN